MQLNDSIDLKNKEQLYRIVVVIAAIIVATGIYNVQEKKAKSLKEQISYEGQKNGVLESIHKTGKEITLYKTTLTKKDPVAIINDITSVAKALGVEIASIKPAEETKTPPYAVLPFYLTLSTPDYHSLARFVSRLENLDNVYIVNSAEINREEQRGPLSVQLTVSNIAYSD